MKTVTILSGKGGVGKSSIAASLAVLLSREKKVMVADCDVDAPNLALCLGVDCMKFDWEIIETSEKAELIKNKCAHCKACFQNCNFNAIIWDDKRNVPKFNKFLCEGCGVCSLVCKQKAIKLKRVVNGKIGTGITNYGFKIISGQLKIGESGSGEVVTSVRKKLINTANKEGISYVFIDASAGIGCPVIASVVGSDYVVAITEPTPAALSDLKRALEVVNHFKIPHGIIINKWDINKEFSEKINNFAKENNIPVLEKIPYDKNFVEALVNLTPIIVYDKSFEAVFLNVLTKVLNSI